MLEIGNVLLKTSDWQNQKQLHTMSLLSLASLHGVLHLLQSNYTHGFCRRQDTNKGEM